MRLDLTIDNCLPEDWYNANLVGRVWVPGKVGGPAVVVLREQRVIDISAKVPTVS